MREKKYDGCHDGCHGVKPLMPPGETECLGFGLPLGEVFTDNSYGFSTVCPKVLDLYT